MESEASLCDGIENYLINYRNWSVWRVIILGQVLSVMLCGLTYMTHNIASDILLHIPTGQSYLHYMLLCAVFTTILACRKGDRGLISVVKSRGYRYILIGFIDVQANTLLATSHQFTTLTSIHLLDCISIPVALTLSCLTLGVRFRFVHVLGVCVCLLGVGCLIWADIGSSNVVDSQNQLVGDMLCLGGAVLFAVVTVLQELVVKTLDCIEYLGMLGLCGSLICGLQTFLLEKNTLTNVNWENKSILFYLGCFSLLQFIFYAVMAYVLKESGATALQLYLLTADFYTLILGMLWKNTKFHALYFLSFLLTMSGIYIYAIKKTPIAGAHPQQQHQNGSTPYDVGSNNEMALSSSMDGRRRMSRASIQRAAHHDQQSMDHPNDLNFAMDSPEDFNSSDTLTREYGAVPYTAERFEMTSTGMVSAASLLSNNSQPPEIVPMHNSTGFSSFYGT